MHELVYNGCKSLRRIPEGWGGFKILDMGECEALEEFLSGVCMLVALEELNFGGCKSLMKFPEGLRGLADLTKLYMYKNEALEDVQSGVCTLMALEEFSFGGCRPLKLISERVGVWHVWRNFCFASPYIATFKCLTPFVYLYALGFKNGIHTFKVVNPLIEWMCIKASLWKMSHFVAEQMNKQTSSSNI